MRDEPPKKKPVRRVPTERPPVPAGDVPAPPNLIEMGEWPRSALAACSAAAEAETALAFLYSAASEEEGLLSPKGRVELMLRVQPTEGAVGPDADASWREWAGHALGALAGSCDDGALCFLCDAAAEEESGLLSPKSQSRHVDFKAALQDSLEQTTSLRQI